MSNPNGNFNVEFEKFVLSAMLLKDGAVAPTVLSILSPDDFYRPEHRIIFNAFVNLAATNKPIHMLSLVEDLRKSGELQKLDLTYVFSLMEYAHTTTYAEYYSNQIKNMANLRKLNDISRQLFEDSRAGLKDTADLISEFESAVKAVKSNADFATRFTNHADFFKNFFLDEVEKNRAFAERTTGFPNIDEEQIFSAGLYVLGATPACGKTTFAWQLLNQLAKNGETCIFCSYEMSRLELFSKSLAAELFQRSDATLTAADIRRGSFSSDLFDILEEFQNSDGGVNVLELSSETVDDLLKLLKPFCNQADKPPVVVVDYLQIIPSLEKDLKRGIDDTVRKLKLFQRDTNTTFIVISSFNRTNYLSPVSFESFKESGNIEYTADVVWALQLNILNHFKEAMGIKAMRENIDKAKKQQPREIQLKCLKNRHGNNYDCYFQYYSAHDYFFACREKDFVGVNESTEPANNSNADDGID